MDEMFVNIGGFTIKISLKINTFDPQVAYTKNLTEINLLIYLNPFIIHTRPKKIDFEIEFNNLEEPELLSIKNNNITYMPLYQSLPNNKIRTYYKLGTQHFETLLKNVLQFLLKNNGGFGIHASCVNVKNKAYLFLGESGAGKSTVAELLNKKYPLLNDDITLVRRCKNKFYIFQTPFAEKTWWAKKTRKLYPVEKIFFIHKSLDFNITPTVNHHQLTADLLKQVIAAQNPDKKILKNANDFIKSTSNFSDLYFAKDTDKLIKLISHIK